MVYKPLEASDRTELRALQSDRLQRIVTHAHENVPLNRERLDAAGVSPEDIQSIDDITKLPMTTKEDFRDEYPMDSSPSTTRRSFASTRRRDDREAENRRYTENDSAPGVKLSRVRWLQRTERAIPSRTPTGTGMFTGGDPRRNGRVAEPRSVLSEAARHSDRSS